jgi:hypothetical protein
LETLFSFKLNILFLTMSGELRITGNRKNYQEEAFKGNIKFLDNKYFYGFVEDDPDYGLSPIDINRTKIIIGKKDDANFKYLEFHPTNNCYSLKFYELLQKSKYKLSPFQKMIGTYSGNLKKLNPQTEFCKNTYNTIDDLMLYEGVETDVPRLWENRVRGNIGRIKPSDIEKILTNALVTDETGSSKVRLSILKGAYRTIDGQQQLELDFDEDSTPF